MPDFSIRDFAPGDLASVLALNMRATDPDAPATSDPHAYPELFDVAGAYAQGAFLVGTVSDEVVAMGSVRPVTRPWLGEQDPTTFELDYMRVAIPHQRRGYARRLVEALEERAASLGARAIVLDTTEAQAQAQRLYEACGFVETHRSLLENEFGAFPLVHYRKALQAHA